METAVIVLFALATGVLTWALLRVRREHDKLRRKERATRNRIAQVWPEPRDWLLGRSFLDGPRAYALARILATGRETRFAPDFKGQHGEDVFLFELFEGQETGYFIEAGATDGVHISISYIFAALGWTGCLVEALPDLAEACRENRPESHVATGALSKRGADGTVRFHRGVGRAWASDVSTLDVPLERHDRFGPIGIGLEDAEVSLTWLDRVLEEADAPTPIDFVVLDIEGAELDALDGFDLERYRPRVFVIEDLGEQGDALPAYFATRGYVESGWVGENRVFIRADETALIERAELIPYGQ